MADDAILVTTETERGRHSQRVGNITVWCVGLLCFVVAVLCWFGLGCGLSPQDGIGIRILCCLMCGGVGVWLVLLPLFAVRGHWRMSDEGIAFAPLRGTVRSMLWRDVEAIHARAKWIKIVFRAGTQKLPLVLWWETHGHREETISFLQSRLGGCFDAFECPMPRTSIRRILRLSVIASAITLSYFGVLILPIYFLQYNAWQAWCCVWMPVALLFLPWLAFVAWQQHRRDWSLRRPHLPSTDE